MAIANGCCARRPSAFSFRRSVTVLDDHVAERTVNTIPFQPRDLINESTSGVITPSLIIFREILETNIDEMIRVAGHPDRLRPHCKTHKMIEVTEIELERGIGKHKCATFAEAEMLAEAGAKDILLAYNIVGPNIGRAVDFVQAFPAVNFSV